MKWQGPLPDGFDLRIVPAQGFSNHQRAKMFAAKVQRLLKDDPAAIVVGFNKMPGLDIYFAADTCFAQELLSKNKLFQLTPRCRTYLELEKAVFANGSHTHTLLIAPRQIQDFKQHYDLAQDRYTLLAPGLNENFCPPKDPSEASSRIRDEFGIPNNDFLLLQVGSAFKTKGVSRAIKALASLPKPLRNRCHYLLAGKGDALKYKLLAAALGISKNVILAGVRSDIPDLMAAADILIHPARKESAGMVLLESLASGLPVICTGICGYANYIDQSSAGAVINEPFDQRTLNLALLNMLNAETLEQHRKQIEMYRKKTVLTGMHGKTADYILEHIE